MSRLGLAVLVSWGRFWQVPLRYVSSWFGMAVKASSGELWFVSARLVKACQGMSVMVRHAKFCLDVVRHGKAGKEERGINKMVYSWKNYGYSVDANIVGKEFEKIEKEYGALTNENVLKSAESESSPIHDVFEWDDSVAAHKFRLKQATVLICNLSCEVEKQESKPLTVRAYYDVSDNNKGSFVNVNSAFKNVDTREIVLKRALAELKVFEEKYKNLMELSSLFEVIDDLVEKGA